VNISFAVFTVCLYMFSGMLNHIPAVLFVDVWHDALVLLDLISLVVSGILYSTWVFLQLFIFHVVCQQYYWYTECVIMNVLPFQVTICSVIKAFLHYVLYHSCTIIRAVLARELAEFVFLSGEVIWPCQRALGFYIVILVIYSNRLW